MRINVLLPDWSRSPIGGYKVAYEYANFLTRRGHDVSVFHVCMRPSEGDVREWLRYYLVPLERRWHPRHPVSWFSFDPRVEVRFIWQVSEKSLPDADVLLVTDWRTAAATMNLPRRAGVRVQVVYDYEFWRLSSSAVRERMADAWRSGARLIATSSVVAEMLRELGEQPETTIECGIDSSVYALMRPPEARPRLSIAFPLRNQTYKGTADAVAAAGILRRRYGSALIVRGFGPNPVRTLPAWVEVVRAPSDVRVAELYNSVSIFVLPSHSEGWGLPAAEAMACGAAVVSTESGGVRDFARHEETAILVPAQDPPALAAAIGRLLDDNPLRLRLAHAGHAEMRRFTWARAGTDLEEFLFRVLNQNGAPTGQAPGSGPLS